MNGEKNGLAKTYYEDGKIKSEREYIKDKLWNLKEYDINNNMINELKDGKGFIREYFFLVI